MALLLHDYRLAHRGCTAINVVESEEPETMGMLIYFERWFIAAPRHLVCTTRWLVARLFM